MISKLRNKAQKGFTLIELMIVVAIIGILAAVAIPAFMRYIAKSKTSEASQMIKKISDGARAYYMDNPVTGFTEQAIQFPAPSVGPTGNGANDNCCGAGGANTTKCPVNGANWANPVWTALQFSMDDPHYYTYTYETTDQFTHFTARANGDLDCDATVATFEMKGLVTPDGVRGMGGIREVNPIE